MAFTCQETVRLYDTDAAGFLFYAAQFRISHAALEEFFLHLGLPVGDVVRERTTLFPVVHAEADYPALTVRAAIDAATRQSCALPVPLRAALEPHLVAG